jgi:hypothetical protein
MFRLFVDDHPNRNIATNAQAPDTMSTSENTREARSDSFMIVNHKLEYSNSNNNDNNNNLIDSTASLKTAMETLHSSEMQPLLQHDPPVNDDEAADGSSAASDLSLDPEEISTVESILDQFSTASAVAGDDEEQNTGIVERIGTAGIPPSVAMSVVIDQNEEQDPMNNDHPNPQPHESTIFQIPNLSVTEHLATTTTTTTTVPQEQENEQDDDEDENDDHATIPSLLLQWLGMQNALSLYVFLSLIVVLVMSWMLGHILVPLDRDVAPAKTEVVAKRITEDPMSWSSMSLEQQLYNHSFQGDTKVDLRQQHSSIMMSAAVKESRASALDQKNDEMPVQSLKDCRHDSEPVPEPDPTILSKDPESIPMIPTMAWLFQRADTAFLPTMQESTTVDNIVTSVPSSPISEPAGYDGKKDDKVSIPAPIVSIDHDDISIVTSAVSMIHKAESFFRNALSNTHTSSTFMAHPSTSTCTSTPITMAPMLMRNFQHDFFLPQSLSHQFQMHIITKVHNIIFYFLRMAGCMLSVILLSSFLFWKLCLNSYNKTTTNASKIQKIKKERTTSPKIKSNIIQPNKQAVPSIFGWSPTPFLELHWDLTEFNQLLTFLSECHHHLSGKGRRGKKYCCEVGHRNGAVNDNCAPGIGYETTNYEKLTKEELLVLGEGLHLNLCTSRQDKSTIIRKVTAGYEASLSRFRVEELTTILAVKGIDVQKIQKTYTKKKDLIRMVVEAGF